MMSSEKFYLFSNMPMRFNGLVIETTNQCNAKCKICYQSASPKGSDILGLGRLDVGVIERFIREALKIPTLTPRVHIAGGEAFLHLEEILHLFRVARESGYLDITGTTNGFWGRKSSSAMHIASQLRKAGVTSIEVSWDYWHADFIRAKSISNCLVSLHDVGIETNLRVLTTRSHCLGEALRMIDREAVATAHRITVCPVFRTGRASHTIPREEFHKSVTGLGGSCHSMLNLTVNSFGYVFPCCAGSDQTRDYLIGNVHKESIVTIAQRMNRDSIIRLLVFNGAASLLRILNRAGIDLGEDFDNMCHLCWTVLSSREAVNALRQYNEGRISFAFESVAHELEMENYANPPS